jgi:hypothetical protein
MYMPKEVEARAMVSHERFEGICVDFVARLFAVKRMVPTDKSQTSVRLGLEGGASEVELIWEYPSIRVSVGVHPDDLISTEARIEDPVVVNRTIDGTGNRFIEVVVEIAGLEVVTVEVVVVVARNVPPMLRPEPSIGDDSTIARPLARPPVLHEVARGQIEPGLKQVVPLVHEKLEVLVSHITASNMNIGHVKEPEDSVAIA